MLERLQKQNSDIEILSVFSSEAFLSNMQGSACTSATLQLFAISFMI